MVLLAQGIGWKKVLNCQAGSIKILSAGGSSQATIAHQLPL
jgi:hypothetical protein